MQVIQTATLPQEARDYIRRINRDTVTAYHGNDGDWEHTPGNSFRGNDGDWEFDGGFHRRANHNAGRSIFASNLEAIAAAGARAAAGKKGGA